MYKDNAVGCAYCYILFRSDYIYIYIERERERDTEFRYRFIVFFLC